jgi:hypothetical protein
LSNFHLNIKSNSQDTIVSSNKGIRFRAANGRMTLISENGSLP